MMRVNSVLTVLAVILSLSFTEPLAHAAKGLRASAPEFVPQGVSQGRSSLNANASAFVPRPVSLQDVFQLVSGPSLDGSLQPPQLCEPIASQPKRKISLGFLTAQVNLDEYPDSINTYDQSEEITIGDLHGNTLKFVYFLVREGIMELGKTPGESKLLFSELRDIYYRSGLDSTSRPDLKSLERFKAIIHGSEIRKNGPMIRLLGDEFADRGENDYFTLQVFRKLNDNSVPFEVLLSNHGLQFLRYYEQELLATNKRKILSKLSFNVLARTTFKSDLLPGQTNSVDKLRLLLKNAPTSERAKLEEEIKGIIETAYLPHLKIASYSIEKDGLTDLYTHAPVGREGLSKLATMFGTPCDIQKDQKHLVQCIDQINEKFSLMRDSHKISEQIEEEGGSDGEGPINYVTWNRYTSNRILKRDKLLDDQTQIRFVHGHDGGESSSKENVINLDNLLGKESSLSKGEYSLFHAVRSGP